MDYTMILCLCIGTLIGLIMAFSDTSNTGDKIFDTLLGVFVGFIVGVCMWFIGGVFINWEHEEYNTGNNELVSLQDKLTTSGDFFLGCGHINGSMQYFGYHKLYENAYELVSFGMDNTIIIEDIKEGEEPYYVYYYSRPVEPQTLDDWFCMNPFTFNRFIKTEVHVPKGSVRQTNYTLDAK